MNQLIKIRDVSTRYDISSRTLRYYEDKGLLASTRNDDIAYRLYDEAAVKRLEQILILRKLNISIKDIQRIFSTPGSDAVLEVLGKKVDDIDGEVSLLHELKEIILDFIAEIKQVDFGKDSDIKMLYDKASDIELRLVNVDYSGNSANINRLLEVTEKLDNKIPAVMVVRVPNFRAVSSGYMTWDELFSTAPDGFEAWRDMHGHLFTPILFDSPDFLWQGDEGKPIWVWRVKDSVTEDDTTPYEIINFEGGLYALAVCIDGDGDSHGKVYNRILKWVETTNFVIDNARPSTGHMIYVDDDVKAGLSYHQLNLYVPIKLKEGE